MPHQPLDSRESPRPGADLDDVDRQGPTSNGLIFDTSEVEPEHRFDAARAFFDGICQLNCLDKAVPYEVDNRSWRIGRYVANQASHGPTAISLSDEHVNREYFTVIYFAGGSFLNVKRGTVHRIGPGFLTTGAEIGGLSTEGFEMYSLEAPSDAIDRGPLADGAFRAHAADSPSGRVLLQLMRSVFRGLKGAATTKPVQLNEDIVAFFELLTHGLAAAEEAARKPYLKARAEAMQRFIDAHLDDPEIGPAQLAAAFGLSRAAVFRALEPFSGVAAAIAGRRMARAYRVLAAAEPRRGLVSAVADRCGYTDPAHFCRVFRRHFDLSPGDVVGLNYVDSAGEGAPRTTKTLAAPRLWDTYR